MITQNAISLYAAIVSSYAAIVATGALLWQVVSWRKSGPVLLVKAAPVARNGLNDLRHFYFKISVTNTGREPIQIYEVGVRRAFSIRTLVYKYILRRLDFSPYFGAWVTRLDKTRRLEGGHEAFFETVEVPEDVWARMVASRGTRPFAAAYGRSFHGKRIGRPGHPALRCLDPDYDGPLLW
ncbi:hypothetical protein [Saccharopolyspora phatthalungensis]|uniref:Uncharacterized protein n=1 Tax=Saccharopolyspora phatthalungensis TaxID=664693 RepID=A0A840QH97_9PSEU|nr:hypothetical protein [Saccharopolyspora phatthalungensis]MBB5156603.1 hypothetical protein [Saccharopolyspora phatthalungensis]